MTHTNRIVVGSEIQKALLQGEMLGQLSDGYWENSIQSNRKQWDPTTRTYREAWAIWSDAEITVAAPGERVGTSFHTVAYNFTAQDLLDVVMDRMVEMVKTIDPNATPKTVRRELSFLKRHVAKNRI